MTVRAFVPGHISCIFQPTLSDTFEEGSRGVGIRLNLGSTVSVSYRDDHLVRILIDGDDVYAPVTRIMVHRILPGKGLDIIIENDLPMEHGFATSASGSLATALCLAEMTGADKESVFMEAHRAEVEEKGGLGDVAAILSGEHIPIRTRPGLPPAGEVEGAPFVLENLTLAVVGDELPTPTILEDRELSDRISEAGRRYTDMFLEDPTPENLFEYSYRFAKECGLMPPSMEAVVDRLRDMGYGAGMCMLGYSIFTDAPEDAVREAAGGSADVFVCGSSGAVPEVTRTE